MTIDINDLTIRQAQEVASRFAEKNTTPQNSIYSDVIGKYVICRSRNEGVNAGYVVAADDTGVVLRSARRIWYHKPADNSLSWYEGVAVSGVSADSKLSCAVRQKIICEDYSLTVCDEKDRESIEGAKTHEQS